MPRLSHDGVNQQTFLTSSATPTLLSQQAQDETGNNALKRPFDEDDSNAHERPRISDEVVRIDRQQSRPMKGVVGGFATRGSKELEGSGSSSRGLGTDYQDICDHLRPCHGRHPSSKNITIDFVHQSLSSPSNGHDGSLAIQSPTRTST